MSTVSGPLNVIVMSALIPGLTVAESDSVPPIPLIDPPFAIVFTHLPKGLEVSEKLNVEATFHGYFLGNILIPADKEKGVTKKDLICPWLIGRTLIVPETKADTPATWSNDVIFYTVGSIVGVAALIALLNYYFRRADRRTQKALADLRDKHHPFSLEPPAANERAEPDRSGPAEPMK